MLRKLLIILSVSLSIQTYVFCMDKKEKEEKSKSEFDKHLVCINQTLQSAGLISEICRLIGAYDGLRAYHQFVNTNGGDIDYVKALTYIANMKYLALGTNAGDIKIWDLDKASDKYCCCITTLDSAAGGHLDSVTALIYIAGIKCLASASDDRTIKLWDLDKYSDNYHKCIATLSGHAGYLSGLAYISEIKYLASSSGDGTIKLWDLDRSSHRCNKCIATFDRANGGHTDAVKSLAYIQDIKCLISGSKDSTIKIWDLDNRNIKTYLTCIATFDKTNGGHAWVVRALTYIPDIKCLTSGSYDKTIKLWDLDKTSDKYLKCIATFDIGHGGHTGAVYSLTYLSDIRCLASGSYDNTIKLWCLDKDSDNYHKCIATFDEQNDGHTGSVIALTYIPEIKYFASASDDGIIKLWINMADVLGKFNINN